MHTLSQFNTPTAGLTVSFTRTFHFIRLSHCRHWFLPLLLFFAAGAAAQPGGYQSEITSVVKEHISKLEGTLTVDRPLFNKTIGVCNTPATKSIDAIQVQFTIELNKRLQTWINGMFDRPISSRGFILDRTKDRVTNDIASEVNVQGKNIREVAIRLKNTCPTDDVGPVRPTILPKVDAGPARTITLPLNYVILNGSIQDPDGLLKSVLWTKQSGPGQPVIVAPGKAVTRVQNLTEGEYYFLLTAMDNKEGRYQHTVRVTVRPRINRPPTADAGKPQIVNLPLNRATLIGNGRDPDGDRLTFSWSALGPTGQVSIINPSSPVTGITNLEAGRYRFVLQVKDSLGLTDFDTTIIIVNQRKNNPPHANAGTDKTITLPVNSTDLEGSGDDPDGDPVTFRWTKVSGPGQPRIALFNELFTVVGNLEEGTHQFRLKVTDSLGASDSDIVVINVKPAKTLRPPIARAGDDDSGEPSDTLLLSGLASSDPDGSIVRYRWRKIAGPPGSGNIQSPSEAQTRVSDMMKGRYEFELKVTDNDGLTANDTIMLQINTPGLNIWIIIASILGIVGVGVGVYTQRKRIVPFWWWWRRKEKIIVFFLNEHDRRIVAEMMPSADEAKGYAVGRCSRKKIKSMKKKGLALEILNTKVLTVITPGITKTYKFSFKKDMPELQTIETSSPQGNYRNLLLPRLGADLADSKGSEFPAFYIMTLDGPLLPVFKKELRKAGISILQRVPDDSYIIFIKDAGQLDELNDKKRFGFIRLIQPYSVSNTGFIARENNYSNANGIPGDANLVLDLILHREEDRGMVRDFLETSHIAIIGFYRNVIRIRIARTLDLGYKLASNNYIQAIFEYVPPKLSNDIARQVIKIDAAGTGVQFVKETGAGEIVAVADTGIDDNHPDLSRRIKDAVSWGRKANNDISDPDGHGTHVTGSIVGDGTASNGKIKGIAPGATIFFQSLLDENGHLCELDLQIAELFQEAYDSGARIMNISWGSATESYYTFESLAMDGFVYDHPDMLVVVAAGNEGKSDEGYVGFGSIGTPATNKNGLTVGASRSKRQEGGWAGRTYGEMFKEKFPDPPTSNEKISGDDESMAAFSSRGLCLDRRIKPDIVAPGTDILSAKSGDAPLRNFCGGYENQAYAFLSGTSMATPIVSGAAAIVREYYKKTEKHLFPGAALIKATLINGTRRLTGESAIRFSGMIPNANQGYGALDMSLTIPNDYRNFRLYYLDSSQDQDEDQSLVLENSGQQQGLVLTMTQAGWIRACLVFVDNPAIGSQTDMDLIVTNTQLEKVWAGNENINEKDIYISAEQRKRDFTNNIEIVRIDDAVPGEYNIDVVARSMAKEEKLVFALVVTTGDLSATAKRRVYDID